MYNDIPHSSNLAPWSIRMILPYLIGQMLYSFPDNFQPSKDSILFFHIFVKIIF